MSDGVHSTFTEKEKFHEKKNRTQKNIDATFLFFEYWIKCLSLEKRLSFLGNIPFRELVSSIKAGTNLPGKFCHRKRKRAN